MPANRLEPERGSITGRLPPGRPGTARLPPGRSATGRFPEADRGGPRPRRRPRRRPVLLLVMTLVALTALAVGIARKADDPSVSPLRTRIVTIAESQLGYRTDPPDSYCNKFSAYWGTGTTTGCAPGLRSEEWCADFAAWVWHQAGAVVVYQFATGDLNPASFSFYQWGVDHGTWHAVGSGYSPQPGDVAVYGLDVPTQVAAHVAVVTSYTPGDRGPNVVNGDGDRTGFSVVETGTDEYRADVHVAGGLLSGYVSPTAPAPPPKAAGQGVG